jgi:hypothetical protein
VQATTESSTSSHVQHVLLEPPTPFPDPLSESAHASTNNEFQLRTTYEQNTKWAGRIASRQRTKESKIIDLEADLLMKSAL